MTILLCRAEGPRKDFLSKMIMPVGKEKSGMRRRLRICLIHSLGVFGNPVLFTVETQHCLAVQRAGWKTCRPPIHVTLSPRGLFFPFVTAAFVKPCLL